MGHRSQTCAFKAMDVGLAKSRTVPESATRRKSSGTAVLFFMNSVCSEVQLFNGLVTIASPPSSSGAVLI